MVKNLPGIMSHEDTKNHYSDILLGGIKVTKLSNILFLSLRKIVNYNSKNKRKTKIIRENLVYPFQILNPSISNQEF